MKVNIDRVTEQLSLQDWRAARSQMYAALSELRQARQSLEIANLEIANLRRLNEGLSYQLEEKSNALESLRSKETNTMGSMANSS